ncbi:MAG: MFS transporter [Thermoplasmatota archaeon]
MLVSALGYAVDLFDLILFTVVRPASLADLHVTDTLGVGALLLNLQSAGLIVGGLLWGILADRHGRLKVLFGSITVYSLANLANALVTTVPQYAALRFLSGLGLAGELGVAITLVSEMVPTGSRTRGTILVTAIGVLGGLSAAIVASFVGWRLAFAIGGALGLGLLVARLRTRESGLFLEVRETTERRGRLRDLFGSPRRALLFLLCILVAVPNWFDAGILLTFAPELATAAGVTGPVSVAIAVVLAYVGLGAGAVLAGLLSDRLRSRRWAIVGFVVGFAAVVDLFVLPRGMPPDWYYALLFLGSFTTGYTAIAVLVTAEQFGTNLRATATASMPNLVRGSVIPLTTALVLLAPSVGLLNATLALGTGTALLALVALRSIPETYGRDLRFLED